MFSPSSSISWEESYRPFHTGGIKFNPFEGDITRWARRNRLPFTEYSGTRNRVSCFGCQAYSQVPIPVSPSSAKKAAMCVYGCRSVRLSSSGPPLRKEWQGAHILKDVRSSFCAPAPAPAAYKWGGVALKDRQAGLGFSQPRVPWCYLPSPIFPPPPFDQTSIYHHCSPLALGRKHTRVLGNVLCNDVVGGGSRALETRVSSMYLTYHQRERDLCARGKVGGMAGQQKPNSAVDRFAGSQQWVGCGTLAGWQGRMEQQATLA